ncbi:hypothetical protein [Vibrio coralliilyticus]|uniref:Uncharacterized protein n=1 Tax=Vibrio coralliilyticus TaxID=190893 RepID=A0AAP6ZSS3_9VIBR|nr:hypothetical protein [Vibrio coralliilyticus]NOI32029.1 hypothetical protein [Vibrio coralliilyticus]NOJ25230.1 hypothetical protein [Vibrio coralliilyticus]
MKSAITLAVGIILGAGCMHLLVNHADSEQKLTTAHKGADKIASRVNTHSCSSETVFEMALADQNSEKTDKQGSSDSTITEQQLVVDADEEASIETLKQEMRSSTENVKLRKLWDLDKEVLEWDDIERVAPNFSYEQKLNMESLLRDNPKEGLDVMMLAAKYPNSGSSDRDLMYVVLDSVPELSADSVLLVDSLIEDVCGQQAPPKTIMKFVDEQKNSIEREYLKRNLSGLRYLINNNSVCGGI